MKLWKRRSTPRLILSVMVVAAPLAVLTSPPADAQVAPAFGFDQVPLGGPPGTLVFLTGRGCRGTTVQISVTAAYSFGPSSFLTTPVAADGTWSVRGLNMPADLNTGRFNITATCVTPTTGVAFGAFDVVDLVNVRPEPVARSSPSLAAVRGSQRLDVVVRDAANAIQWSANSGGSWAPYTSLGAPPGGAVGDPAIVSWAPGRLDLFVRGLDNKLWQRFSTNAGTTWSDWIQPVGAEGTLASGPDATSRGPGLLDVVVAGTDGALYQRFWDGQRWNTAWLRQGAPGGGTPNPPAGVVGTPTATSPNGVNLELFARDTTDRIWQQTWNGASWSGWYGPDGLHSGTAASRLDAASWGPGHLSAFVRGNDGFLYHSIYQAPGWFQWQRIGFFWQTIVDGPAAASRGFGRVDVVARGTDDRLYMWSIG